MVKDWYVTCIRIECSALNPCNDTSSLQIPVTVDGGGGGSAVLNNWVSAGLLWKSLSWLNKPSQTTGAAAEAQYLTRFYQTEAIVKCRILWFTSENSDIFAFKAAITGLTTCFPLSRWTNTAGWHFLFYFKSFAWTIKSDETHQQYWWL